MKRVIFGQVTFGRVTFRRFTFGIVAFEIVAFEQVTFGWPMRGLKIDHVISRPKTGLENAWGGDIRHTDTQMDIATYRLSRPREPSQ